MPLAAAGIEDGSANHRPSLKTRERHGTGDADLRRRPGSQTAAGPMGNSHSADPDHDALEASLAADDDARIISHALAEVEPGLRIHFVTTGKEYPPSCSGTGFPQTWWQWRHVIPALAAAGFRVVAPDYRGAGHLWRSAAGYDKQSMAHDIYRTPARLFA